MKKTRKTSLKTVTFMTIIKRKMMNMMKMNGHPRRTIKNSKKNENIFINKFVEFMT
jgi:hypothetical protein